MELEFRCLTKDCDFTAKVEWPEEPLLSGKIIPGGQMRTKSALTEHHRFTRPENTNWSGHADYQTIINGQPITVNVSGRTAAIDPDGIELVG